MFVSQERVTEDMGKQLESMTKHYGQMEDAVREREAGVILGEEDLAGVYLSVVFFDMWSGV